ncbi:hypothetical protein DSL72_003648 [Monilinia vaccinii-corymbosi]|uniref:BAH domain-containing protein n=1 Tax=Monilinia vaccinii-corymbosi TaxID=61207 RepID=A0A8A3P976_9HELO|nr:hypothetical protein DSL72_003648 [Monilinia vaccinii-corymbosi]
MTPKHDRKGSHTPPSKRVKGEPSKASSVTPPPDVQDMVTFEIKYPVMNPSRDVKESKENSELRKHAEEHISPFKGFNAPEKALDLYYSIVPHDKWVGMRKFNNFIIQDETFKSSETVYVKGKTEAGVNPQDFWVARVLQVRASDRQHVYALVAWMYWPEELGADAQAADEASPAAGRRKYHGSAELIASNHLDILDVTTFAGRSETVHFSEEVVDCAIREPDPKRLYWRQTFCRDTHKLSDLPVYCICNGHYNPDIPEYEHICDNEACKTLYHSKCLVDDALTKKHHEEYPHERTEPAANDKAKGKKKRVKSKRKIYSKKFKGEFVLGSDQHATPMIKITDLRCNPHTETTQRVACPKCSTLFE